MSKLSTRMLARIICLVAGMLFLYIGINRGQALEVLQKAIQICMECIGIG